MFKMFQVPGMWMSVYILVFLSWVQHYVSATLFLPVYLPFQMPNQQTVSLSMLPPPPTHCKSILYSLGKKSEKAEEYKKNL